MDALPEASQHDDIMAHTADQLNASLVRIRQARQVLLEASHRLTLTRQAVEKDPRIERAHRAGELLHEASQFLAQTREQMEGVQRQNAADPATDVDSLRAGNTS
jgi:hypothetical protein